MGLEDVGYHVLGPIARGGMAEVLLAERVGPGGVRKRLAIKRLLRDVASDPELVQMLENEARISVELDHPNVVSVFELGEADGELFLAMEFVRGWDLATLLDACRKRSIPVPVPIALFVIREICRALEYAHERKNDHGTRLGIVHRDVTPSNVLLSADGAVKLADFGIARAAALAKGTTGGSRRGKVPYLSPEQISGETLDARSDLYSLGIIAFFLLAGRPLFSDDIATAPRDRQKPIPRLGDLREEARALEPILDRILAFDPKARYASARELGEALDAVIEAHHLPASESTLRSFLDSLKLPPPVGPGNVADGERTMRIAIGDGGVVSGKETTTEPMSAPPRDASAPPDAKPRRSSTFLLLLGLVAAFGTAAIIARLTSEPNGSVEIRTTPPGATIWIDGTIRGTSPTTLRLPRRPVALKIGRDERSAETFSIDLGAVPDQTLDVDVR